jgi:hypothetical protein
LSASFDKKGNVAIAYYDLTTTKAKFNYTTSGLSWLATPAQISSLNTGREGLTIQLNPTNSQPAISYYDRANNFVYYTACSTSLANCSASGNWSTTTISSTVGVSGIPVASEQLLNTSLTYSASGIPYITYMSGIAATTQGFGFADNSSGSFLNTTLGTSPNSAVSGASAVNFSMIGFSESSTRTTLGTFLSAFVGPNNWLYAATCGD